MSNSEEEMLDNTELSDDNYVTYIIGEGTEIVIHRFKIELEDGQDIEAVIKQLDDEMEAMHGQIRFRMDWNYNFMQWSIANDGNQRFCFWSYYSYNKNIKWKWYYSWSGQKYVTRSSQSANNERFIETDSDKKRELVGYM